MTRLIIKSISLLAALAFLPAFGSGERLIAPSVDPWPKWEAHDAGANAAIDHGVWDELSILGIFLKSISTLRRKNQIKFCSHKLCFIHHGPQLSADGGRNDGWPERRKHSDFWIRN